MRERFSCRSCESITQPPAPFHPIARGRAGPNLLAMVLEAKFGQHLPLNRQSETYGREGVDLSVSTLADGRICLTNNAAERALLPARQIADEDDRQCEKERGRNPESAVVHGSLRR